MDRSRQPASSPVAVWPVPRRYCWNANALQIRVDTSRFLVILDAAARYTATATATAAVVVMVAVAVADVVLVVEMGFRAPEQPFRFLSGWLGRYLLYNTRSFKLGLFGK